MGRSGDLLTPSCSINLYTYIENEIKDTFAKRGTKPKIGPHWDPISVLRSIKADRIR